MSRPLSWCSVGQCHLERGCRCALLYDVHQLAHYVRVLACHVVVLVQVGGEVVKPRLTLHHHEFPVASAHAYLVGLVKLPVEVVVTLLRRGVSEQRRGDGQSVETVARQRAVGVSFAEVLYPGQVAEAWA